MASLSSLESIRAVLLLQLCSPPRLWRRPAIGADLKKQLQKIPLWMPSEVKAEPGLEQIFLLRFFSLQEPNFLEQ